MRHHAIPSGVVDVGRTIREQRFEGLAADADVQAKNVRALKVSDRVVAVAGDRRGKGVLPIRREISVRVIDEDKVAPSCR